MVNNVQLFKGDCLEIMKGIDDKYFEIAKKRIEEHGNG